jgi:hypothetical protein
MVRFEASGRADLYPVKILTETCLDEIGAASGVQKSLPVNCNFFDEFNWAKQGVVSLRV